jgi:hypothetical protein
MAKRMASRTQAKGQMLLGTVLTIKQLQLLIWWMASRTQAERQMLLGTIIIKRLQLVTIWWIRDHAINRNESRGLVLDAAGFAAATMSPK